MNFKHLFIFFLKDANGKPKISFIYSFIGLLIGSYSVFMIMSIMNGIQLNFTEKVNSYHYKYYVDEIIIEKELYDYNDFNAGYEKIGSINKSELYAKIIGFSDFNKYFSLKISKLSSYSNNSINEKDILIGKNIASNLNLNVGDKISIFYPSDINIASSFIDNMDLTVYGIYDIDFLDFNNNIITGINNLNITNEHNLKYYYDDLYLTNNKEYMKNNIYSNLIIDGLKLEKKVYYFFALFAIILSCFMLFSTMILSVNEKIKQFVILNILGMDINKIARKLFILNFLISSLIILLAINIVNVSLYLYEQYNYLNIIYKSFPFLPGYISFYNIETIILFLIMTVIISFFSTLPLYYLDRKEKYVKF